MCSQFRPVFVLLVATFIKSGVSIGDLEYGVTQAEKTIKGVCWFEKLNAHVSHSNCDSNEDYVKKFKTMEKNLVKTANPPRHPRYPRHIHRPHRLHHRHHHHKPHLTHHHHGRKIHTPHHEEASLSLWIHNYIRAKLFKLLPTYHTCAQFLKATHHGHQKWNKKPETSKNYGWLLGDEEKSGYPFKEFCHCLLGAFENKHGKQGLSDLETHWGNPESLKEEIVTEEENKGETGHEVEGHGELEGHEEVETKETVQATHESEYEETYIEEEFDGDGNLLKRTQKITKKV